MKDENFFCEITKSEMGYDEDVFLYFSIMDELSVLISEIKDYDTGYKYYDDLIRIAYTIPDYEYKNIGILDAFKDKLPGPAKIRIDEILMHCNMQSKLLYTAYTKARIALHYFVKLQKDQRFNKIFNNENLIILKSLMRFFLYRFDEINNNL